MTSSLRILHVLHNSLPLLCGYSIRSGAIVSHQRSKGLDPIVVTSSRQPDSVEERIDMIDGTPHFRTGPHTEPALPILRERALMRRLQERVEQVIEESHPHIVHAHSPVLVGLPALLAARKHGLPFVYEIRDLWENASVDRGKFRYNSPLYRLARGLETYVLRRADAVVTICEALRWDVATRVPDQRKVFVVGNGVDTAVFDPASVRVPKDLRRQWNLEGKQVIAYVGTFQPYEGLDLLVRAMPAVLSRAPNAHLLIVGGSAGESTAVEQALQTRVASLALEPHVTFTGRVPHAMVKSAYAIADVVVCPRLLTRTTALTTPLKPLEAMALGRALVLSDVPGMRELVRDGDTGVTFPAGDVNGLAGVCVRLLEDPALRRALGERAHSWVLEHRQWPTLVARYQDIYMRLAELTLFPEPVNEEHVETVVH
jgi:PEP-CTERM/exosortase A-associated glycosyltransferase